MTESQEGKAGVEMTKILFVCQGRGFISENNSLLLNKLVFGKSLYYTRLCENKCKTCF